MSLTISLVMSIFHMETCHSLLLTKYMTHRNVFLEWRIWAFTNISRNSLLNNRLWYSKFSLDHLLFFIILMEVYIFLMFIFTTLTRKYSCWLARFPQPGKSQDFNQYLLKNLNTDCNRHKLALRVNLYILATTGKFNEPVMKSIAGNFYYILQKNMLESWTSQFSLIYGSCPSKCCERTTVSINTLESTPHFSKIIKCVIIVS